tara:strand:- start:242 stop:523 length:282 start_codon:yes stop_codon:yes gene_type:complete
MVNFSEWFKIFFYGTLGSISAQIFIGLFSVILFIVGYHFIKKYNKKGSKPLQQIQNKQYIGLICWAFAILPWIRYFIAGFGFEAGEKLFNELF